MFDSFKIIAHAFSGKFGTNAELRKGFWVWVSAQVFSIAALAYSSTMSYAFYLQLIDQAPAAPTIAAIMTALVAIFAYMLINVVSFRTVFIWNGGKMASSDQVSLFLAFILMVGVVWWDVQANLTGVDPIAVTTTASVFEKDTEGISSRYQSQINEENAKIAQIHKRYTYRSGAVVFEPAPKTSNSRATWQADVQQVEAARANIARLKELRDQETGQELATYDRDLSRYENQVLDKSSIHTGIVKWVYGLVFLISLWSANYSNLALDYLEVNPLGDIPGDQTDKFGSHSPTPSKKKPVGEMLKKVMEPHPHVPVVAEEEEPRKIGFIQGTAASKDAVKATVPPSQKTTHDNRSGGFHRPTVRKETVSQKGYEITCDHCGTVATKKSPRARFCSPACRKADYREQTGKEITA
jgi:hypothetical protein